MPNVAVIGAGYWGPNLVRNFVQLPSVDTTVCCDRDPGRLQRMRRLQPGISTVSDYRHVLEDPSIDAVVLATPVRTHHSMGREALLHGKHLLVEKPLALSTAECRDLIGLADERGLVLMAGHTFLFNPAYQKVKELAHPDHLGETYYLYSNRVNLGQVQTDISALWSIAPHDVSIMLDLMGQDPLEVSAQGVCHLTPGIHDVVFLTLAFPGDVMANIHVSWLDPSKVRRVTVVGSRKMIVYDDVADEAKVKVYDKGVLKDDNGPLYGEFQYRVHSGDIYAPRIDLKEPLANECAHFVECIETGLRPISDGENGLRVVQVLETAQRSLENRGAPVAVLEAVPAFA